LAHKGPFLLEIRLGDQAKPSGKAYDDLYAVESLSQIESYYLWLLDGLAPVPNSRLLDISCGAGELVRCAQQQALVATGIDISEVVVHAAHRLVPPPSRLLVGTGESLPFPDATFDYVTNIGSLEHFVDPAQGVREMARVLRPGGKALVLVPNTFSLLTTMWYAFRTGETSTDHQPIQRYGARADWTNLLGANGLVPRKVAKYERTWPRKAADWGHYLRKPKELARLFTAPFVPLNLAFCFLFTCERSAATDMTPNNIRLGPI
jgi:SAM-dependent methyltransferase